MKQTRPTAQQQQQRRPPKQPTASEIGLTSITSLLGEISSNSSAGLKLLESIDNTFNDINSNIVESISSSLKNNFFNEYFVKKEKSTNILSTISTDLRDLSEFIISGKKPKTDGEKATDYVEKNEHKEKSGFDIKSLTEFIINFSTKVNSKFFNKLKQFNEELGKLLSFDSVKVEKFSVGIGKLTDVLEKFEKDLDPMAKSMMKFTISLGILSIVGASPLLPIAFSMISLGILMFRKALGKNDLPKHMDSFGLGLLALAGAMLVMQFVPFSAMFKMLTFITALGFALRPMRGTSVDKEIWKFGAGMALMTLALVAFSEVSIFSILKMISFIGLLGMTLKIFDSSRGIGPFKSDKSELLNFAFGLGLLVIAILAFDELPFMGMIKLLTFIALLGAEIIFINKFGGGFGVMKGLPGFAFGLGLLVLAMYAMNELPWSAIFETLVFIAGLGLALKLYNPASGMMMLEIGVGILALAAALWVYKQTNLTLGEAGVFLLVLGGLTVAMLVIGAASEIIIPGAAALIIMSIATGLAALALMLVAKVNVNWGNIVGFIGASISLALGFALLTPFAIIGVVGAALFIPIAISAGLAALALMLISNLTVNQTNIDNFVTGMKSLAIGYSSIVVDTILGAAASLLFLPIAITSLISVAALALISKFKVNLVGISSFKLGMRSLISAYTNAGSLKEFALASLNSIAMLQILNSAAYGSKVMGDISNSKINNKSFDSFALGLNRIVLTYNNFNTVDITKSAYKAGLIGDILKDSRIASVHLSKLSGTPYNHVNISGFSNGILILLSGYNAIDTFEITKSVTKSGMLNPILHNAFFGAKVLGLISNNKFNQGNIAAFSNGILILLSGYNHIDTIEISKNAVKAGMLNNILSSSLRAISVLTYLSKNPIDSKNIYRFRYGLSTILMGWSVLDNNLIESAEEKTRAISPLLNSTLQIAQTFKIISGLNIQKSGVEYLKMIDIFGIGLNRLSEFETNGVIQDSIRNVDLFVQTFKEFDSKEFRSISFTMDRLLDKLSDKSKWNTINSNISNLNKNLKDIVCNINMLNLNKAIALERDLKLIVDKNNSFTLNQILTRLKEVLGLMYLNQKQYSYNPTTSAPTTSAPASIARPPQFAFSNLTGNTNTNNTNNDDHKRKIITKQPRWYDPDSNGQYSTSMVDELKEMLEALKPREVIVVNTRANPVQTK